MDYPDPDVIRVDDTYYMVTTTMHFMPGCEILRSHDLLHWEHLTYVYDRLDSTDAQRLEGDKHIFGKGMWAASIRYHEGTYYIIFVANDTQKTYLYRAENIEGPWRKSEIEGFYHDCSLLFDNGKAYLVYGNTDIYLTELNAALSGPAEGGLHRLIVSDRGNKQLGYEGSHLYKIDGRYYLFLIHSERERWMRNEACFIADSLEGEFTGGDVLSDDMGLSPMGVAQGGIVDDGRGNWYAVLFQDSGAIGRIPAVVPVTFEEGKVIFGVGGKVPKLIETEPLIPDGDKYGYEPLYGSDDFSECYVNQYKAGDEYISYDKRLFGCFGLRSFWQFSHEPELDLIEADTEERILKITTDKLSANLFEARNVLTQRMVRPVSEGEVTILAEDLREGDYAGLSVYQGDFAFIGVTKREGRLYAVMRTLTNGDDVWALSHDPGEEKASVPLSEKSIRLRIKVDFRDGRDEAVCSIIDDVGNEKVMGVHKLRFRLDHFTGARFGLFVYSTKEVGGCAGFKNFTFVKRG